MSATMNIAPTTAGTAPAAAPVAAPVAPAAAATPAAATAQATHESLLGRIRADVETFAKAIGVDVEKIVALVKEHL